MTRSLHGSNTLPKRPEPDQTGHLHHAGAADEVGLAVHLKIKALALLPHGSGSVTTRITRKPIRRVWLPGGPGLLLRRVSASWQVVQSLRAVPSEPPWFDRSDRERVLCTDQHCPAATAVVVAGAGHSGLEHHPAMAWETASILRLLRLQSTAVLTVTTNASPCARGCCGGHTEPPPDCVLLAEARATSPPRWMTTSADTATMRASANPRR